MPKSPPIWGLVKRVPKEVRHMYNHTIIFCPNVIFGTSSGGGNLINYYTILITDSLIHPSFNLSNSVPEQIVCIHLMKSQHPLHPKRLVDCRVTSHMLEVNLDCLFFTLIFLRPHNRKSVNASESHLVTAKCKIHIALCLLWWVFDIACFGNP
jgi:hypothetical protein